MKKKWSVVLGVSLAVILLSLSLSWAGKDSVEVIWGNGQNTYTIYEFNEEIVKIGISLVNYDDDDIANITLSYNGINSLDQEDILAPAPSFVDSATVIWSAGYDNAVNIYLNITALEVSEESNFNWIVETTDVKGKKETDTLTLNVLNDNSAPRYTLQSPASYAIMKNEAVDFGLLIDESESGFLAGNMIYDWHEDMSSESNEESREIEVSSDSGTFEGLVSGINLDDKLHLVELFQPYFSFFFNLTDKAGNSNFQDTDYWIYVDEQKPEIILASPENNAPVSSRTNDYGFDLAENTFGIDENFLPEVNCTVYINENPLGSAIETDNGFASIEAQLDDSVPDGFQDWNIICIDSAGWEQQSETRTFLLDTTGPAIELLNPAEGEVIRNSTNIELGITDALSDISQIWYESDKGKSGILSALSPIIDTSDWPEGRNALTVYANDSLGNGNNETFTVIIDLNGPAIEIISPANNSFNNNRFRVKVTDDYSSNIICSFIGDGVINQSDLLVANGSILELNPTLNEGEHSWSVTCSDEVNNPSESETRMVIIDITSPVVTLDYPLGIINFPDAVADFNYTASDAHPDSCVLMIDENLQTNNDYNDFPSVNFSSFIAPANEAYYWKISCNDSAGNQVSSDWGELYYDTFNPVISNLSHTSISSSSALISWNLDENSNNTVYYGTNKTGLLENLTANNKINGGWNINPAIEISGLSSSTTYFYVVVSCDQFGYCSDSSAEIDASTFSTTAPSSGDGGNGGSSGGGNDEDNSNNNDHNSENQETNPVVVEQCQEDWQCGEWAACSNNAETRACEDLNSCGTQTSKPTESRECQNEENVFSPESELKTEEEAVEELTGSGKNSSDIITGFTVGGVLNLVKNNVIPVASTLVVLGIISSVVGLNLLKRYKLKKQKKEEETIRQNLKLKGII